MLKSDEYKIYMQNNRVLLFLSFNTIIMLNSDEYKKLYAEQ